jgi:hypothetical protein
VEAGVNRPGVAHEKFTSVALEEDWRKLAMVDAESSSIAVGSSTLLHDVGHRRPVDVAMP